DLVEVRLEDLFLGVVLLHLAGGRLLAKLAQRAPVGAIDDLRVHVAHELLRNRTRAAGVPEHGILDGAGDAHEVHAVMLVEPLVLYGDERLRNVRWQAGERDADAQLVADFTDEGAVAGQHEGGLWR